MENKNIFMLHYKDAMENPTLEFADSILNKITNSTVVYDGVCSIGGGSTIDTMKYVAWKLGLPHHAIPTTAGSGSEVTKYAVFMVNNKKKTIEVPLPTSYELRPELVVSCPAPVTMAAGLDALAHAIESTWSPKATEESKVYAKKAIEGITDCLWDSYNNPSNQRLRACMLESANNAGKAINITKTSISHALSYSLTAKRGTPHGVATASTLLVFMKLFNTDIAIQQRVNQLLSRFGIMQPVFTAEDIKEAKESERFYNTPFEVTDELLEKVLGKQ